MTIYELTQEYLQLLALAEDELTDPQTLDDTMEAIQGEIEDKADAYAKIMLQLFAQSDGLDKEIKRLTEKKRAIDNNATQLKDRLQQAMEATGKTKFKTDLFSFGIQKNPVALVIDDAEKIPKEFLIAQAPKVDNAGIKAALKAGQEFDWCHLSQSESLRIR